MSPITKSDISSFRISIRTTKPSVISVLIFNPSVIHRGYILPPFFTQVKPQITLTSTNHHQLKVAPLSFLHSM